MEQGPDCQRQHRGTFTIDKQAPETIAHQENKNILLSPTARVTSLPMLEANNHEVYCGHGSAVSMLDAQQLFYLASRGLDNECAQRILLESFCKHMLLQLHDKSLRERMHKYITQRIAELT